VRAARIRRRVVLLATTLVVLAFLAAGLERRIQNASVLIETAAASGDQRLQGLTTALGSPRVLTADALPPALAIFQRSADAAKRIPVPHDAVSALAELLRAWPLPPQPEEGAATWLCTIQSLGVSGHAIAATLTIEGDAAAFLRALTAPQGWTLEEPRLTSVGGSDGRSRQRAGSSGTPATDPQTASLTRITLQFKRQTGGGRP
jgi:hypothetical protein